MKDLYEIIKEEVKERQKYFKNYIHYLKIIKEEVRKFLPEARVYVFGSVVRKEFKPNSDIDVLIVTSKPIDPEERGKLKGHLYRKVGFFSPFEIHLVDKEGFGWYKRFIKGEIEEVP